MAKSITVEVLIDSPIEKVWTYWTSPSHITEWNHASDDWECPKASNDFRVGGKFNFTMAAKDGSFSFDFEGTYTTIRKNELIEYSIIDGRNVSVSFSPSSRGVLLKETFEMETQNSEEMQRRGWQAILNNFKKHVEEN